MKDLMRLLIKDLGTLCAEYERYTGYSMNKVFVHLRTSRVAVLWRVM